jgi:hypothetical protein
MVLNIEPLSTACNGDTKVKSNFESLNVYVMIKLTTPSSLKAEHDELHQMLTNARHLSGKTGEAAEAVAQLFESHFIKEEQYALPALALLPQLAEGNISDEMEPAIKLCKQFKKELPGMLNEHQQILAALEALKQAAFNEHHPMVARFAEKLKLHAKTEEEILYPAAALVGEYLKMKLNDERTITEAIM